MVNCDSQTEIDQLWAKLLVNGGRTLKCGWIQD
ncbi:MAG: VOC family protein [Methylophaga sp.]|nr:VOC family protein [Methylophaga sp.]MDX1749765.1 VOC family protein [Methylophaga sp.]